MVNIMVTAVTVVTLKMYKTKLLIKDIEGA